MASRILADECAQYPTNLWKSSDDVNFTVLANEEIELVFNFYLIISMARIKLVIPKPGRRVRTQALTCSSDLP
jgi:hypothetical protein